MSVRAAVLAGLAGLEPVSLAELEAAAELQTRVDTKYVVDWPTLGRLLDALAADHQVLEIAGRRTFLYDSIYFDSPERAAFRDHVQGRRRRFKIRARHYVDTDVCAVEVKVRGRRGQTVKHRMPSAPIEHGRLDASARAFVARSLHEAYGHAPPEGLEPALRTGYRRITLAAVAAGERVTCDYDVRFCAGGDRDAAALSAGHVIVEAKSAGGRGRADRVLRELGARPLSCSKYVVGIGLTGQRPTPAELRRLTRRYFLSPTTAEAA